MRPALSLDQMIRSRHLLAARAALSPPATGPCRGLLRVDGERRGEEAASQGPEEDAPIHHSMGLPTTWRPVSLPSVA